MITILDYQMGNLRSVAKAIEKVGEMPQLVDTPEAVLQAEKLIVPGVGGFPACMAALKERGLEDAIQEYIKSGRPYLGICLGMQILMEESEEFGKHAGLGIFKGKVVRFAGNLNLKIPHMGWNSLEFPKTSKLFADVKPGAYVYFVHSYFCVPKKKKFISATSDYGYSFAAAFEQDNIFAVQFHPEKSQKVGLKILENFCGV